MRAKSRHPVPDDRLPRGIIITSGAPRRARMPFWAYFWSAADEPLDDDTRPTDRPSGPRLAQAR
ncbi:MAG: hypothetical protein ACRENB_11320 [Gemmatimonadales bacterium]